MKNVPGLALLTDNLPTEKRQVVLDARHKLSETDAKRSKKTQMQRKDKSNNTLRHREIENLALLTDGLLMAKKQPVLDARQRQRRRSE